MKKHWSYLIGFFCYILFFKLCSCFTNIFWLVLFNVSKLKDEIDDLKSDNNDVDQRQDERLSDIEDQLKEI